MKIIANGPQYIIYDDNIKTYDYIPSGYYTVEFVENKGFTLNEIEPFKNTETLYGDIKVKIDKVINAYNADEDNLGIILSGVKGIGKSLFARELAATLINTYDNFPIIIVNEYIHGIADYLASIKQDCMILFDEFDKVFKVENDKSNSSNDPQTYMLTLFDGVLSSNNYNKIFVITCNDIDGISPYIINRPGRFHYHFRFDFPTIEDIKVYLNDNINNLKEEDEQDIINFCRMIPLNYDCLKALCKEINRGYSFKESISDLNIINTNTPQKFIPVAVFNDGTHIMYRAININVFSREAVVNSGLYSAGDGTWCGDLGFKIDDIKFTGNSGRGIIPNGKFTIGGYDEEDLETNRILQQLLRSSLDRIELISAREFKLNNSKFLY